MKGTSAIKFQTESKTPQTFWTDYFFVATESRRDDSMVADKMKDEVQPRRGEIIKQIFW